MGSAVTRLAAYLALAFLSPAPLSRCARQSIGGRRFGRRGGVLTVQRQLPFQIGDLLSGVGDFLLGFKDVLFSVGAALPFLGELLGLPDELLPQPLHLMAQALVLTA